MKLVSSLVTCIVALTFAAPIAAQQATGRKAFVDMFSRFGPRRWPAPARCCCTPGS